jgi:octaprenyl-diphosphate synthase
VSRIADDQSACPAAPDASQIPIYGPIENELADVEQLLRAELRSDYPSVDELVRYGCLLGGKRMRPALLLLVAKATGKIAPAHITLGAVVEMIHTATLVHDDVLDEADTRRHLATVNARWDVKSSVLLGDFLFTHAFYLASTLDSTWACRQIGRATNLVCEGELRQKGCRGDFDLGEAEYVEIISAKTAELCACSCQLGAHYAGASVEAVAAMTGFGRDLGVAFQIIDDILDLLGTGKSLGTDLEQQKPTLPIIRELHCANPSQQTELLDLLQSEQRAQRPALLPLLARFDAVEYARQVAHQFVQRAQEQLCYLPVSPVRDHLHDLCGFVLARSM